MELHVSVITLGVKDLDQAKRFYSEGLGCPILKDEGQFVSLGLGDGSSTLALYRWDALADDAGVAPEGSGFRGMTLSYITDSADEVDAVLARATKAGAQLVKPAKRQLWGGYSGTVTDPEGHIWKVASNSGPPLLRRRSEEPATPPAQANEVPVVIGVSDVKRAKHFYEAQGCPVGKSYGSKYVSFTFGDTSDLALYKWDALADDGGVAPEGSGFRGFTFSCVVEGAQQVDEILARAGEAGATISKPAEAAAWGGYSGYFTDPDGILWKVASAS